MKKINNKIKIRIFLWLILFIFIAWLLILKIVPSGEISYITNFKKYNFFISKLSPLERIKNNSTIINEPVYFSLNTPRRFNQAKLILKYYSNEEIPAIIEAGILADKINWRYNLFPVENKIIDNILSDWHKINEGDNILLQKNYKKYNNINEFLDNPPELNKIAVYNYDLKTEYLINNYNKSDNKNIEIKTELQGSFQIYTYIKDEILNFNFIFKDINKNKDKDSIDLIVYYQNKIILTKHLDDSILNNDRNIEIKEQNLPEGVYKIELRANDDIITKNIKTTQKKLSFVNNIKFYKQNIKNIILYTNGEKFFVKTIYPNSLGEILINENILNINETYKQFSINIKNSTSSLNKIILDKSGIEIACNGIFSFSEDLFIDPRLKKIDNNFNINNNNQIEYIIAKYKKPKQENKLKIAEIIFDLRNAYSENNKYNFIISAPGVSNENNIKLEEIKIELFGEKLIGKIKSKLF